MRRDRLARDDLRPDRGLDRDLKHLPRNQFAHLRYQSAAAVVGKVAWTMIDSASTGSPDDQDVQLHHRRFPVPGKMVVERSVPARDGLQPVVEIEHDFVQRQLVGEHHAGRR